MSNTHTRAPKQIGDFGEGLVTYALIRDGYEMAVVDHVGADLIAARGGRRFAISVKTRLFRKGSNESRITVIKKQHLEMLKSFSDMFGLTPMLAQVVCMADDQLIHLLLLPTDKIDSILPCVEHGYTIRFGPTQIDKLTNHPDVQYWRWREEQMGKGTPAIPAADM